MKLFGNAKIQGSVSMAGTLVLAVVTVVLIALVIVVRLLSCQQVGQQEVNRRSGGSSHLAVFSE